MGMFTDRLNLFKFINLTDMLHSDIHITLEEFSNNFEKIDKMGEVYVDSKPISGAWEIKQKVWNSNPTSGKYMGWVCVRAGVATPTWKPLTQYNIGDLIQPTEDNGHYYECVENGTSAPDEPMFLITSGVEFTDNRNAFVWKNNYNADIGEIVMPTVPNGFYYRCIDDGTTDTTTEPEWITTEGSTIADGTVIWQAYKIVKWKEKGTSASIKGFGLIE